MNKRELNEILKRHAKWLRDEEDGERADLSDADLSYADLSYADLRYAYLNNANLICADLSGADLSDADLSYADLKYADLSRANLANANLSEANLSRACLIGTDLIGANLSYAELSYADIRHADLDETEQCRVGQVLTKKLIGYKKCRDDIIVKLEIPKGATVFGINNHKFRTNTAKCVAISDNRPTATSVFNSRFIYEIGKTYTVKDFDCRYNVECSSGIHFFKTKKEAKEFEI